MNVNGSKFVLLTALFTACASIPKSATHENFNDLLLRGGRIETRTAMPGPVHASFPTAIAVRDGKILFVGSDAAAAAHLGRYSKVVDLAGSTILPDFIDALILPNDSHEKFADCYLNEANTLDDVLNVVRSCVAISKTGWLRGSGWSHTLFESVPLTDNPLDYVETTGPIALVSSDGHSYWVNHVALSLAGIKAQTPDPRDGVIGRKVGSLEPSGLLHDRAMGLIDSLIPKRSLENTHVDQAIARFMTSAAHATFWKNQTGVLVPGMRADFVLLNHDPYETPPNRLGSLQVVAAYKDGLRIYTGPLPGRRR